MNSKETNDELVMVQTDVLRQRLNGIYDKLRGSGEPSLSGQFDYLWDLKERATLEKRAQVAIPETWLVELEEVARRGETKPTRGVN